MKLINRTKIKRLGRVNNYMINKYVQPKNSKGCSLYCLSNFTNQPLFEQLESNPWLGEMTVRKEEKILCLFSLDNFRIIPILYHNSNLKYVSYQEIGRALKMVMDYSELQGDLTCVMPMTIYHGVLHQIYLYVQKDRIFLSDPLKHDINCFKTVTEEYKHAKDELKTFLTRKKMYPYRLQIIGEIDEKDNERPIFFNSNDFKHLFT
jgi:hypothetical protein